ncbi:hypothetical protein PG988_010254 [Apiospora saccharicola]
MLSSVIKTALLLAGVAQADFVMMRFLAPRDTDRPVKEGFYFHNLTDAEVAQGAWPEICPVSTVYPKVGSVSEPYDEGVVINGDDLSKPDRVEVFWGRDEGHWTLYGNHHGGSKPYDIIDTKDQKRGHCNIKYQSNNPPTGLESATMMGLTPLSGPLPGVLPATSLPRLNILQLVTLLRTPPIELGN